MYVYEEMVDVLYNKFPELTERYAEKIEYYKKLFLDDESGTYIHYESFFNRYIEDALKNEPKESRILDRIFVFFEEMATSEDAGVNNLLQVALLESIWSIGYDAYKRAIDLMLPKTKELSNALISYLREPKPGDTG